MIRLLIFFLFALSCSHAHAKEKREDPLKNNPALEKQIRLEVYRLVSQALTFNYDDLYERLEKNKDDYTVQGCKRTIMTINSYNLLFYAKKGRTYVGVYGIWKKKFYLEPLEQIKIEYIGQELGERKVWAFSLPLTLYIARGVHKLKQNKTLGGKILEKEKNTNTYRLHLMYPEDYETVTPQGFWPIMPNTQTKCKNWGSFGEYDYEDKKPYRMEN